MEKDKVSSVYIHIPFCNSICSYCDFCKFYYQDTLVNQYLDILLEEMKAKYQQDMINTIYIGGGTPSCLTNLQLEKLLKGCNLFSKSKHLEFTIECNISDITEDKLKLFQQYGVNRLSIGVESFQNKILKVLDRNENKKQMIEKIILAKQYFSNINIDLIYAVPNQTMSDLKKDLKILLSLDVSHISTYSLIIEEHTKLKINQVSYISSDVDLKMYQYICDVLEENGYLHYEISNFCKPGYESKHNLTYWKNEKYYGFGLSASGYIKNVRYTNTKNIKKYLAGNYVLEEEKIDPTLDASNQAILGLRTIYGVDNDLFLKKFKKDFVSYFSVEDLIEKKILRKRKNCYYIDSKYWYLINEFLIKFI